MSQLFLHLYVTTHTRLDSLRDRARGEAGLTSVEWAVVTGLVVAAALAIVAIIRATGEDAARDVKYK